MHENTVASVVAPRNPEQACCCLGRYGLSWLTGMRIVLYDTLLQQCQESEVVAVLAHELGAPRSCCSCAVPKIIPVQGRGACSRTSWVRPAPAASALLNLPLRHACCVGLHLHAARLCWTTEGVAPCRASTSCMRDCWLTSGLHCWVTLAAAG